MYPTFMRRTAHIAESAQRLSRVILEMAWNDDIDRSDMDDEVVRMIQLNGMIGADPEVAEIA